MRAPRAPLSCRIVVSISLGCGYMSELVYRGLRYTTRSLWVATFFIPAAASIPSVAGNCLTSCLASFAILLRRIDQVDRGTTVCCHHDNQTSSNMNTTSFLLTGRPADMFAIISPVAKSSTTPASSPSSSPRLRPRHLRRTSSDSTGWYLDADTPSLKDFEKRAQTLVKRIEKFLSRCATNVVMGLMSPAAVALFLFNPITLVLLIVLLIAMIGWK